MRAFNQDFLFGNIVTGKSDSVPSYFDGPVGGEGVTPANNPHGAGWRKIKRNEPVCIDYTCVLIWWFGCLGTLASRVGSNYGMFMNNEVEGI